MSTRLTAAEISRMQAFLTELLDREARGTPTPDVRSVQEQFWAAMRAQLCINPMSSGLQHLDQLARDTMDATPGATLQGTVLALPAQPPADVSIPAFGAAKGKAPTRSKRKSVVDSGKATAKKPRAALKSKDIQADSPKPSIPPSEVETKPPAASTLASTATPLADTMGVSSRAPVVVRQAIEAVLRHTRDLGKSPFRLAFPWSGRPLWYDPVAYPDVHRAHWRFWIAHRRAFWDWAFHAPLEPGSNALANRRKIKLRAIQARPEFLSFCIETWGFYDFMERLDRHPQLFWFGGCPGRTSDDTPRPKNVFAEDLAWLFDHDTGRYEATLKNALNPDSIDSFGYPNMRSLLGTTEALFPHAQPKFRLSDTALARIRFDLSSSQKPKDSWAGPITEDPWRTLYGSSRIQTVQAKIVSALIDGTYTTPTSKAITKAEDRRADNSDLDEPGPDSGDDTRSI